MEVWKDIVGFEGFYQVSNLGNVRSTLIYFGRHRKFIPRSRIRKFSIHRGYPRVALVRNRKRTRINVHRLVCTAFVPNPLNKPFVNHINGIKTDNRVENLEWCTHEENVKHALEIGLIKRAKPKVIKEKGRQIFPGELNGGAKLTESQVREIRLLGRNYGLRKLADRFFVSQRQIARILDKEKWKHI